jgi:HAD superfamily hydrolase (TIGR01484 family)
VTGRIELVVTDLDGTLWGADHVVHPRTRLAVEELTRRDVGLLAATARRAGGARRLLAVNGLTLPAVLLDGALVRDAGGRTIHADRFNPATAAAVLARFRAHGLEPCISVLADDDLDARLGSRPSTHPDHVRYLAEWARRADLDEVVAAEPVQSFVVCGMPADALQPVAAALEGCAAVTLTWDAPYRAHTITVRPPGVDKWRGVQAFCARHGIDEGAVLAVGDGLNDVELLQAAAIACVVEGSDARVLAVADHVVGPPETGGWADLLAHLR